MTGGGTSGEHLNIPVQMVDVFVSPNGKPCSSVGPLTRAGYNTATCAASNGDSGGPVYSYAPGFRAQARGTIVSGLGAVPCSGLESTGFRTVFYAPLVRPSGNSQVGTLATYGVSLLTCGCAFQPVVVPDLTGQTLFSASALLEARGLHLSEFVGILDFTCNNIGIVADQNPDPGGLLFPGDGVQVAIGEMPPFPFECP
jgi:hypothetical protein